MCDLINYHSIDWTICFEIGKELFENLLFSILSAKLKTVEEMQIKIIILLDKISSKL
jgi:hypothetical protein